MAEHISDVKWLNSLLRLIVPVKCMGCREITLEKAPFCRDCLAEFALLLKEKCPVCGRERNECNCIGSHNTRFLFYYHSDLSKRVTASLKYHATDYKVNYIAALLRMLLPLDGKYDAVVYPPRSAKNKRKYGFDQSEMLATALGELLCAPCFGAIKRNGGFKRSKTQKLLSAEQRIKNVRNAFSIDEKMLTDVKNVVLLDDVVTTGATVTECTRLLKKAGVKKVTVISVAKTPKAIRAAFKKTEARKRFKVGY